MSSPNPHTPSTLPSPASTASFWHSQPSPLLLGHRSTRALPTHADVVVVGSGITGASVAHHLLNDRATEDARRGTGTSVVMLEAREACWGATGRNGGHCQPLLFEHPHDPSIGHFELHNFHTLKSLIAAKAIDCEFHQQHGVRAIYTAADLSDAQASVAALRAADADLGARVRVVTDVRELRDLRVPTAHGAVVTDVAARMWPYKFVARILEDLLTGTEVAGSFNLQTHTPVLAIRPATRTSSGESSPRWTVSTPRGEVEARSVVLGTNGYTSFLLDGFADLIVPCRGQMSALVPPPSAAGEKRLQTSYGFVGERQDDYLIQRPSDRGEHLMFGGGRAAGHALGVADDSVIDTNVARYLRSELNDLLGLHSGGELKAVNEWSGIMGFSRDNVPWVGPVPKMPGLFVSAGYTGHGMPNTWLCGKAAALMVMKAASGDEATAVRDATAATKLPEAYLVSESRVEQARELASVEAQDERCMFRAEKAS